VTKPLPVVELGGVRYLRVQTYGGERIHLVMEQAAHVRLIAMASRQPGPEPAVNDTLLRFWQRDAARGRDSSHADFLDYDSDAYRAREWHVKTLCSREWHSFVTAGRERELAARRPHQWRPDVRCSACGDVLAGLLSDVAEFRSGTRYEDAWPDVRRPFTDEEEHARVARDRDALDTFDRVLRGGVPSRAVPGDSLGSAG
jgi:hypothetical protein